MMTVKELRELLDGVDDEYNVSLQVGDYDGYGVSADLSETYVYKSQKEIELSGYRA